MWLFFTCLRPRTAKPNSSRLLTRNIYFLLFFNHFFFFCMRWKIFICRLTVDEKDSDYHKMINQCQQPNQDYRQIKRGEHSGNSWNRCAHQRLNSLKLLFFFRVPYLARILFSFFFFVRYLRWIQIIYKVAPMAQKEKKTVLCNFTTESIWCNHQHSGKQKLKENKINSILNSEIN